MRVTRIRKKKDTKRENKKEREAEIRERERAPSFHCYVLQVIRVHDEMPPVLELKHYRRLR